MSRFVEFSLAEWSEIAAEARARTTAARACGRVEVYGSPPDPDEADLIGVAGERAVCVAFCIPWRPRGSTTRPDRHEGDVAPGVQVRTRSLPWMDLILHRRDALEVRASDIFILVVRHPAAGPLTFEVVGWIVARDGMKQEFWNAALPRPAYLVPRSKLWPLGDIAITLAERAAAAAAKGKERGNPWSRY